MGYPELDQDESIILETRNVKFKSISLDAILTNKRIILIDSKKDVLPPQDIPLTSIRIVEMGENAIRDPFLLLILSTVTGEKRQLVITFSRLSGAERKRECNEWVKKLDSLREAIVPDSYPADIPVPVEEPEIMPEDSAPAPAPAPTRTVIAGSRPVKKKIEISRPLSKIIEKSPVSPVPVETSSLPSGTFCSRCGNRVPLNSTFCNHCGTPIVHVPEKAAAPQPAAPSVKVTIHPTVSPPAEQQNRPIDQVIHSIEPLIEDSVPRTQSAPLVQKNIPDQKAEPPVPEPAIPAPAVPALPVPEPQQDPTPQVNWPVLSTSGSPMVPAKEPEPAEPEIPPPPPAPVPGGRETKLSHDYPYWHSNNRNHYRDCPPAGINLLTSRWYRVESDPPGNYNPGHTLPHNNAKNPRDTGNYHPGNPRPGHGIDTSKRCMGESHVSRNVYRIDWYAQ